MFSSGVGIVGYADGYLFSRDLSPDYADTIRRSIASFSVWAARTLSIGDVDCDLANAWLCALQDGKRSAHTIDTYRRALLAIWNDAIEKGDNHNPPLRLKRIKKPRLLVRAYTLEQIRMLVDAASRLPGSHRNGNRVADVWAAAIHVGYSTGLRRGDLLTLSEDIFDASWAARIIQHKTNYPVTIRLSRAAVAATSKLNRPCGKLVPWPYEADILSTQFKKIAKRCGLPGTLRWLRRSAGSHAEKERRGNGPSVLGQRCEKVFWASYGDLEIIQPDAVSPPEL